MLRSLFQVVGSIGRSRLAARGRLLAVAALGSLVATTAAQDPPGTVNPEGNTGILKTQIETGGGYAVHTGNATRAITDLSVPGALGAYGLSVVRYWESSRIDTNLAGEWDLIHAGGGWTNNWNMQAVMTNEWVDIGDGGNAINLNIEVQMPDGSTRAYKLQRNSMSYPPAVLDTLPPYTGRRSSNPQTPIQVWAGGAGLTDHLGEMDPNGMWFWIERSDGGAIKFSGSGVPGYIFYRASELRDPNGLVTTLSYDPQGRLLKVREPGGRCLHFSWAAYPNYAAVLQWIGWTRTDTDLPSACVQKVVYSYVAQSGLTLLSGAQTDGDPQPAAYLYESANNVGVALRAARDPRFAGPMQKIRYVYRGEVLGNCTQSSNLVSPPDNSNLSNFTPSPASIYEEQAWDGQQDWTAASGLTRTMVSRFVIPCNGSNLTGTRTETNGLGNQRTFWFGPRAGGFPTYSNNGYELGKMTDFFNDPARVQVQYYSGPVRMPVYLKDFRGTLTLLSYDWAASGHVTGVARTGSDQSTLSFDYVNAGASDPLDTNLIKNSYSHWLFAKTDERGFTTTYTRDARRRVKRVDYPGGAFETFTYNAFNQVLTHTLPLAPGVSVAAVETRVYDARQRLIETYNSVDGADQKVEYTYYDGLGTTEDPTPWADLLKTVRGYRARTNGAPFTAKFEYNSRQQITRVYYPATDGTSIHPFVQYDYDNFGRCWKITDEEGHWRVFSFDDYGRCTQLEEQLAAPGPDGNGTVASRKWNWIYDRIGYAAEAHTSKQWRVQIEPSYNMAGRRRLTAQYFDVNDRITAVQTGWTADANGNNWVAEPEMVTSYAAYDVVGNKTSTTDPLGRVTTMTYDLRNRQLTVTDPLNQTTTTAYNTTGQKTLVTFPDGKTQQFLDIDAFGQAWRTIDERNNTTNLEYGFGPMKKLTKVTTTRDKDAGGTESQVTTFQYDAMGRETVRWFPDGTCEQNTIGWGGEVIAHKMRRGRWQWFHRDVRQRDIWSWWDDAGDAGLQPVARVWDKASRLTSIANDVSTITYTYDAAGQVLTENNNIAGGPSGGRTQTYYRYGNGAVSRLGYPGGSWFQRNYNARGELIALVQVSPGNPSWSWTAAEFFYYADGKPSWTNRGNGAGSRYFYDGKGNLSVSEHFQALGGLYYAGGSTVLTAGQGLTRGRYYFTLQGDGNLVLYENGTPRWATGTNNGAQLIMQTDGNLVLYTAGGSAAWATWTQGNPGAQFVFQEDGNLVVYAAGWQTKWHSNTAGLMAGSVARRDYARDNRDRIVAISKGTVSGNLVENGRSDRFVYDAEGQLTDAYYDAQYASGPVSGQAREDHFVYDQLGNRKVSNWSAANAGWVTWTRRDTTQQNPNMNGLNQIKTWGGAPANWDDQWNIGNGNLIQDGTFTAWYNALNQPMWSSTTSTPAGYANFYGYDPLGRCVKRWYGPNNPTGAAVTNNPATYFYYEGWNLIEEADGNATLAQTYLHGARVDEIVARYRYADAKWYFHHYDGRTHCQVVTTNNAAVAEQYQYDAFGWPYLYTAAGAQLTLVNGRPVSAIGNRFLFTGREWLTDWGVYDYRHRQYHPKMGRFIQPDPKHFGAGDYNLYRYCHNDPVNKIDPLGLNALFLIGGNYKDPEKFTRIAHKLASKYAEDNPGEKAYVVQVRRPDDIARAFKLPGLDHIQYIGHAGVGKLYLSGEGGSTFKNDDIGKLSRENVRANASICLAGCHTGEGNRDSMAQRWADHFQRPVTGVNGGLSFGIPWLGIFETYMRRSGTYNINPFVTETPYPPR